QQKSPENQGFITLNNFRSGEFAQVDRNHTGDTFFDHGNTIDDVGRSHRAFVVRDNDELTVFAEGPDDVVELVDVGIVERCVDLVENTERSRFQQVHAEQQRRGGQRLLPTGQLVDGQGTLSLR